MTLDKRDKVSIVFTDNFINTKKQDLIFFKIANMCKMITYITKTNHNSGALFTKQRILNSELHL